MLQHEKEIRQLLKLFDCDHLPPSLRAVAEPFKGLAHEMAEGLGETGDFPYQLKDGLYHLLKAKDAMVRQKVIDTK